MMKITGNVGMDIQLFALNSSKDFGIKIVEQQVGIRLAELEECVFEDGEHEIRSLECVRGRHVFILHSLYGDIEQSIDDKLVRLLFFIGALKDASACEVSVIIPYFAYARKDRKTNPGDPVSLRYMAQLLESVGADRVVTLDIHNLSAFQNAFRIPTDHLEARILFAPYVADMVKNHEVVVVSPDFGGIKRAKLFKETLSKLLKNEVAWAFLDKNRTLGFATGGEEIFGEVEGRFAVIVDDMVCSGTTLELAIRALARSKVKRIIACVSHGLFLGAADKVLSNPKLDKILITNSVFPRVFEEGVKQKIKVFDAASLFSNAIKRIYVGV